MLDVFGLPSDDFNVQVFTGCSLSGSSNAMNFWHAWQKPRGAKIVFMLLIGAGSGGGKGASGSSGTNRGGGAGGLSGNVVTVSYMAAMLPDILYIQTPIGGKGADATAAGVGGRAIVALNMSLNTGMQLIASQSNGNEVNVGANGSTSGSAATGVGNGAPLLTSNSNTYGQLALSYLSSACFTGGSGGTATGGIGGPVAHGADSRIVCGGAGGGGVNTSDFAGGNVGGAGTFPTLAGGAGGGNQGLNGYINKVPLSFSGGSGGGSNNLGTGGNGGDGAYGCGGGGGGGGVTGGAGGKGGDAIVQIVSI